MVKRISIKEDLNKENYLPLNKALTADEKKKKSWKDYLPHDNISNNSIHP